jgi:hypothetical protein
MALPKGAGNDGDSQAQEAIAYDGACDLGIHHQGASGG